MKYILPIIIAALLGATNSINIHHLKPESEEQSSYDIESAQDDPQEPDLDSSAKEPKNVPMEIDNIKDKIQDLKDDIKERKEEIFNKKSEDSKKKIIQQEPTATETVKEPVKVLPASEDSTEMVISKANGFESKVTRTITKERYITKGIEKDKMTATMQQKYDTPGHEEGKVLNPKSNSTKTKNTVVHIIPYSKASGLKKAVDDEYSGTNSMAQKGFVRMILESVVEELEQHPDRKFTFSEVKFLQMWYTRASKENKDRLKKLIKNGQFEITTGGWTSTDEACPNYEDLINNVMIGHQFLQTEFNFTPRIGWNLEAFGHSNTNARLFAQLGFDAQFFTNVDHKLKDDFKVESKQKLNFLWEPASANFGNKYQILTSIIKDSHKFPGGFYADSGPDVDFTPIVDDQERSDYNAPDKAYGFINYVNELAASYQEDNVLLPMGTDFAFQNAGQTFKNIEKLIDWINKNQCDSQITYKMSTPSEYIKAINNEKHTYTVFKDDFVPFIDNKDQAFSGMFTSKAAYKKQIRESSSMFHSHQKQLAQAVLRTDVNEEQVSNILKSKDLYLDALGIVNDQFSISGGLREKVQQDDERRLNLAKDMSNSLFKKEILDQTKIILGKNITQLSQCLNGPSNGNDTVIKCPIYSHRNVSDFLVIIKNPKVIGNKNSYAKIMVDTKNYKAQRWNSTARNFTDVESDIFEQSHYDYANKEFIDYQMFIPGSFRPGQIVIYRIVKVSEAEQATIEASLAQIQDVKANETKSSSLSVLGIGPSNDILFNYLDEGVNQTFGVNLKYYQGHNDNQQLTDTQKKEMEEKHIKDNSHSDAEGIWTLKPEYGTEAKQYSNSSNDGSNVVFQQGQFVDQYSITFQNCVNGTPESSAVIRVRFSPTLFQNLLQFDVEIGTISMIDQQSKDVTVNWKMYDDFDPKGVFWTDSNGLEMQKRTIVDDQVNSIKVSRNYYPIDSAIAMRDQNGKQIQVTVMNNRPQGGSADLSDKANIEIMQHRRIQNIDKTLDSDFALNETEFKDGPGIKVNAEYNMQIFNFNSGKSIQREQQIKNDQPMEYFFSFDKFDTGKATAEPVKKECKDEEKKVEKPKVDKAGEAVKDANIIHRVVKPAPTYIKEVQEHVASPVKTAEKKEEKKENVVEEAKVEKEEKKEEKTAAVEENADLTKTNQAQEKTISEEIQNEISSKVELDMKKEILNSAVKNLDVKNSSALYSQNEDFKFVPVPLTKEDKNKGMLYHQDEDAAQVQSEAENTELDQPVSAEAVETETQDVPEESLVQLQKDLDEVDDGSPNQIGQIDQSEDYDTNAAIEANENAQTNQEAIDNDADSKSVGVNVTTGATEASAESPVSNETANISNEPTEVANENITKSDQIPQQKNSTLKPKGKESPQVKQDVKVGQTPGQKTVNITVDVGGPKNQTQNVTQPNATVPPVNQTEIQAKIANLLSKLPKYAKNVSISINPVIPDDRIMARGVDASNKTDAQQQIEQILKDLKQQMANQSRLDADELRERNREKYPFNTPIDISKGNMFTKNFKGFTYQLFPLAKNKVLVRLENLLDKFDITNSETKYFDMVTFSKELWYHSQLSSKGLPAQPRAHIEEMSLNGASSLQTSNLRLKWISNEDCKSSNSSDFIDKNSLKGVALSPQSIRTFIIDYNQPVVKNETKQVAKVRPVDQVLKRAAERRAAEEIKKQNEVKKEQQKEEAKVENKTINQKPEPVKAAEPVQAPEPVKAPEPATPKRKQINVILDLSKGPKDESSEKAKVPEKKEAEPKTESTAAPQNKEDKTPQVKKLVEPEKKAESAPSKWKEVKMEKYVPLKQQLKRNQIKV